MPTLEWTRWIPMWALLASPGSPTTGLQAMVDATPEGGTLFLQPGRYQGPLVVHHAIVLDGGNRVTIDGGGTGTVVRVLAAGTVLRNLRLTGSGNSHDNMDAAVSVEADACRVEHCRVDDALFGVLVKGAQDALVCGNTVSSKVAEAGMRGDAVRVWNGHHNRITGNDIHLARDVTLANSRDNVVRGNRIRGGRNGLQLVFAPHNEVDGNFLDGNLSGVVVLYSDDVTITRNLVQDSRGPAGVGVVFKESSQAVVEDNQFVHCSVGARTNSPTHPLNVAYFRRNLFAHNLAGMDFYGENGGHVIEDNRFEHNLSQVTVSGPMSARGNRWVHNSWDDYQGFDRDGDGVGDTPYQMIAFADRIWMEMPMASFFRNSPALEMLDFLERLAPFASPELILQDPRPAMHGGQRARTPPASWDSFVPACPGATP